MVSHRYHTETLQHLAETNHFTIDLRHKTVEFSVLTTFLLHIRSMTLRWNAYIHDHSPDISVLCPSLKRLVSHVDMALLVWQCSGLMTPDWNKARKMQRDWIVTIFEDIRGLETFTVVDNVHRMPERNVYTGEAVLEMPTEKEREEWCEGRRES